MAKKRGNGEGSITQLADGRWQARLMLANGKRKAYYAKTRAEAALLLRKAQSNADRGLPVVPEQLTVSQFLTQWLETVKPTIKARTYTRYEQYVRLHLKPELGSGRLARLAPQHIQRLYAKKLEEKLSPTTVAHLHAVLHLALTHATKWGLVARNVTEVVDAPRLSRTEMHTLSPAEVQQLLSAAKGDAMEALYVLAVTTGMRQGELLGLHWRDVDFEKRSAQVRASLQRTPDGLVFAEPKTSHSRRQVMLTPQAVDALRRHRTAQSAQRLRMGPHWEESDIVFANEVGRPMEAGNVLRRSFWPLLKRAELPHIRFHELRHTAATLLLHRGVHPKVVQEMLGHSQIAVTLDLYSHVTPTLQREAADAMEAILLG